MKENSTAMEEENISHQQKDHKFRNVDKLGLERISNEGEGVPMKREGLSNVPNNTPNIEERTNENSQPEDPHLTLFSFFNVLNLLSGIDEVITPAAELFSEVHQEYQNLGVRELKDILQSKVEQLKQEESEIISKVDLQSFAKDNLQKEIDKIEKTIDSLEKKKRHTQISLKCAQAAVSYLSEQLSDQKIHILQSEDEIPIDERLSTFLWFLQNSKISKDQNTRDALMEFFKYCISLTDDQLASNTEMWISVINELVNQLKVSRPDTQHLQLRILTEICRNPVYIDAIKKNGILLPILTKLLSSINDELCGEACMMVTVLANTNDNRKMLGSVAIPPLVELLWRSQNEDLLEKGVTALWNLSLCDENKVHIRENGGVEGICALLKHPFDGILENSTIALGYLTRDDLNKMKVRECGGLKLLLDVLNYPKESIQSKAAGALWNCASNNENKGVIRQHGGITKLIELIDSSSESVIENVTGALWNLAVDSENKREILECDGIPKLVKCLSSNNQSIVENASGTLWNCSSLADVKAVIRKSAGLQILVSLLYSKSENIQENAAGALRNCAMNDQNKITLRETGAIRSLISLLDKTKRVSVLEKISSILWLCSIDQENKIYIKENGGFSKMVHLLQNSPISVVEKVLGVLRNCSTVVENKIEMSVCGAIPELIRLLSSKYPTSIREFSVATLWNLARNDDNKVSIREYGGIKALINMLMDKSETIQQNAAGSLLTLTMNADNRVKVREENGLPCLVHLLSCKNEKVIENALSALKNCAANEKSIVELRELKSIPKLIMFLQHRNEIIVREAALCLKNLAMNEENNSIIGKYRGLECLLTVMNATKSEQLRKVIAITIQTLAKNPDNIKIIENLKTSNTPR